MTPYISLHNYTHFSILNSLIAPKDLFLKAKELNQDAIAITDLGSLAGAWDALKYSKEIGVKSIIGSELYFVDDVASKDTKLRFIVLIAKNLIGYRNLLQLSYNGFKNGNNGGKKVVPIIDWNLLKKYSEGLICLTACGNGIVGQLLNNKKFEEAEAALVRLNEIFGQNLGVEVQAHNLARGPTYYSDGVNQVFTNQHLIRLAKKLGLKIIPTTSSRYLKREQQDIHDTLLAVGSMQPKYSNNRMKYDVSDFYPKSGDEIVAFFSRNYGEDFAKEICANTIEFANMCEESKWIDPKFSNPEGKELPIFPVKDEPDYKRFLAWQALQTSERRKPEEDKNYLRYKCEIALREFGLDGKDEYRKRLEIELDTLYYCGVSSYMLIVADYVNWAKNNGVSVGPGRGSAGGSLVSYLLGIHLADPIRYGLVFERFHNKLKSSYSDIDMDFSKAGRGKVIDYIIEKYGIEHYSQITNFNYITPKVYVKDVSRSCELGGSRLEAVRIGNDIADIIPKHDIEGKEIRSYQNIIDKSPLFVEYAKKYKQLNDNSSICGKPRSLGIHASGIIISNRPVADIVPVRIDKDNVVSVQFDKDKAEEAGLVKMDILGLETLDIIDQTNSLIKEAGKKVPVIDYEVYDKKTYDLISSGNTYGVFQFGTSAGTIDLCKKIKPKNIEDLATITTLARPASKEIREDYVKVREGKAKIKLLHPSLEGALKNSFGFPLYDESLLILAKDVAGWDLGEADKLRKLTKEKGKNPEKAEKWRQEFVQGAIKNGVAEKSAIDIWHTIVEPFGRYSFNLSHAVLYSMISYTCAYYKAHFSIEFLLANLMSEIRSGAKIAKKNIEKIKQEIRNHGVLITPPDINKSDITYKIQSDGSLLTGFEALKNVGDDAIKDIIEKRPFKSFDDFMLRTDTHKIRSNTIQALAVSGCLDSFGISRKLLYLYCSDYKKKIQVWLKKHDPKTEQFEYPWPIDKEWNKSELYALEKECMGEAFVCGMKEAYGEFFNTRSIPVSEVRKMKDRDQITSMRVEIKNIFEFKVKKETSKYLGEGMIKAMVEDEFGEQISLTIFPSKWKEVKERMRDLCGSKYKFDEGIAIHFGGSVNVYEEEIGVVLNSLFSFSPPPQKPKNLKIQKVSKKAKTTDIDIVENKTPSTTEEMISDLEDDLFEGGFIDLENEEDED